MIYTRGSEWNRWDFHIHTPETLKNDCFEGHNNDEKWNKFYDDILNYIGDGSNPQKNIVAIGITDYLSIKNYEKVLRDGKLERKIPFIFPNVELRITPVATESPINIHCIFNPTIANQLESRFFGKLKFNYGRSVYSAAESELIRLGKSIDVSLDDNTAAKKGREQFVIPLSVLEDIFNADNDLRQNTIIVVSNKTTDGASGIANSSIQNNDTQLYATRTEIYKFTDFIFSANERDIKYFLGKGHDSIEDVCKQYNKLIPCVIGCDAHSNDKIFEPANKKYCWIKAHPSFSGMKELAYEPEERVRIQELKPEEKPDYCVIDSVIIEDENFDNMPIPFSDKLTCIIGGKSTGKSLLLHNMAEAIDHSQVEEKLKSTNGKYYKVNKIKVIWRDGVVSTKDNPEVDKKIIYLPQTYLNKLSDETEEKTEIDEIIHGILVQNESIATRYSQVEKEVTATKKEIDQMIYDLISLHRRIKKLEEEKLEKGDSKAISAEIVKLKKKKESLIFENSISQEDISKYDRIVKESDVIKLQLKEISSDKAILSSIEVISKNNLDRELSGETYKKVEVAQEEIYTKSIELWEITENKLINELIQLEQVLQNKLSKLEKEILIIKPKIDGNAAVTQLSKEIILEEKKLLTIKKVEEEISAEKQHFDTLLEKIANETCSFKIIYDGFSTFVNDLTEIKSNDIEFIVSVPFRTKVFFDRTCSILDKRKLSQVFPKNSEGEFDFSPNDFDAKFIIDTINKMFDKQTYGLLKSSIDIEEAIRTIASDWYNITYTIKMDGDEIEKMSPGKKALVLLKLLINLAESKCPILIDQPEDDLDNRSIYLELVHFLKTKKIDRQIIVVTHNANIVVGSDSEEIIIANQRGNNAPNLRYRFEYRSGAIEDTEPICDENGQLLGGVLYQKGIQAQICEILEGGKEAFNVRNNKYFNMQK